MLNMLNVVFKCRHDVNFTIKTFAEKSALGGAPFDLEKFDEFFRMVSAVHEVTLSTAVYVLQRINISIHIYI